MLKPLSSPNASQALPVSIGMTMPPTEAAVLMMAVSDPDSFLATSKLCGNIPLKLMPFAMTDMLMRVMAAVALYVEYRHTT